mgnify:CR=1 FL=1
MSAFVFGNKSLGQNESKLYLQICNETIKIDKKSENYVAAWLNWSVTYICIIEVVSSGETDEKRLIAVFAHQLVQLLANVVHLVGYFNLLLQKLLITKN